MRKRFRYKKKNKSNKKQKKNNLNNLNRNSQKINQQKIQVNH